MVLAAGPIAILLAGPLPVDEGAGAQAPDRSADALGAVVVRLIGVGGLIVAGVYLKDSCRWAPRGMLLSAGMMPLNSIAVGLEVTGAFLLTWTEFLDQTMLVERGARAAMSFLPFAIAAWLFVVGLWGVVSSRNLVRTVLSLTVVQSATYLLLLGVGYRNGARRRSSRTSRRHRGWSTRSCRCWC